MLKYITHRPSPENSTPDDDAVSTSPMITVVPLSNSAPSPETYLVKYKLATNNQTCKEDFSLRATYPGSDNRNRTKLKFKNPISIKGRKARRDENDKTSISNKEMTLILDSLGLEMENEIKVPEASQSTVSEASQNSSIHSQLSCDSHMTSADRYIVAPDTRLDITERDEREHTRQNGKRIYNMRSLVGISASFDEDSNMGSIIGSNTCTPVNVGSKIGSPTNVEVEEEGTEVTLASSVRLRLGSPSESRAGVARQSAKMMKESRVGVISEELKESRVGIRSEATKESCVGARSEAPKESRVGVRSEVPKESRVGARSEAPKGSRVGARAEVHIPKPQKKRINSNVSPAMTPKGSSKTTWTGTMCAFYSVDDVASDVAELMRKPDMGPEKVSVIQCDSSMEPDFIVAPPACCKTGCIDDSIVIQRRRIMESRILCLLGSNGSMCDGWHTWFTHVDDEATKLLPYATAEPDTIRSVLHNRVINLHERTKRISRLRQNIGEDCEINGNKESIRVRQVHSDIEGGTCRENGIHGSRVTRARSLVQRTKKTSQSVSITEFLDTVARCGDNAEQCCDEDEQPDDLCYDSDPELACMRRDVRKQKKSEHRRNISFDSISGQDDTFLCMEIMNMRMNLVWHPTPCEGETNLPPIYVKAWIEQGHQLRNALIQPKFIWTNKHELEGKIRQMGLIGQNLHSVDLLDISRILTVNKVDRTMYPLAQRRSSFIIETFDRKMLFEASSQKSRDRIVHGLKIMVARLGSKIIVNDDTVFDDFFTPTAAAVPGDAAVLTKACGKK